MTGVSNMAWDKCSGHLFFSLRVILLAMPPIQSSIIEPQAGNRQEPRLPLFHIHRAWNAEEPSLVPGQWLLPLSAYTDPEMTSRHIFHLSLCPLYFISYVHRVSFWLPAHTGNGTPLTHPRIIHEHND